MALAKQNRVNSTLRAIAEKALREPIAEGQQRADVFAKALEEFEAATAADRALLEKVVIQAAKLRAGVGSLEQVGAALDELRTFREK